MKTSEQINELAAALVQARKAFTPIKKTHTANVASAKGAYKYTFATLDDVYAATTAGLTAAGIFPLHNIETSEGAIGVATLLMHASGQFIHTDPVWLPAGATPQSVGSAISYARRYSLQAALGVAAEEDDDGQQAAKPKPVAAAARPSAPAPPPSPTPTPLPARVAQPSTGDVRVISEAQRKRLFTIAKKNNWSEPDIKALLARHGYASSKDIKVTDYDGLIATIETGEERELGDDSDELFPMPWDDQQGAH